MESISNLVNSSNKKNLCDINEIYYDPVEKDSKENIKLNSSSIFENKSLQKIIIQNKTEPLKRLTHIEKIESESEEEEEIFCQFCKEKINQGEIINYCNCEIFYHPNCLLQFYQNNNNLNNNNQSTKICNECKTQFSIGIYNLNNPLNLLNTYTNENENKKNENKQKQNNQSSNSTCDKTIISMDTNINKVENYNKMCGLAFTVPHESMIEIIKNDNISHNLNYSNNKLENNLNSNEKNLSFNRIALSPINHINTPYSGNKSKYISSSTDYLLNKKSNNLNDNSSSPDISFNNLRQHLNFLSNQKEINNNNNNNGLNRNLINIFNLNIINQNTSNNNINNNISFRRLSFDELNEENNPEDDDKENQPPLPKENSKFGNIKNLDFNLEIKIEGGISHIISNIEKIIEVPITIEINCDNDFNYSKDTLLIFNTIALNISTIIQILKCYYEKMDDNDKIYSNIFKVGRWLNKEDIFNLINGSINNYTNFFQETEKLDYIQIAKLILFGIDMSLNVNCNIFSILIINDIDEIDDENNEINKREEEIKSIVNKLKETKINLLKFFSINTIVLDDKGKVKNEKNLKFVSYLYDISLLCMGYFYSPKDANELMISLNLFFATIQQYSLLNIKLLIKGNKDPSIYLEGLNYPLTEKSHNNFEICMGSLLKKERKLFNMNAKIFLNNTNISLSLPLLEVSCEYLAIKNKNLLRNRTEFYSLSIPVISSNKEISISNTVLLRNITAQTAQKINNGIFYFKDFKKENALNELIDAKNLFENLIRTKTNLFNYFQYITDSNINSSNIGGNINVNNINFSNIEYGESFIENSLDSNSNLVKIFRFIMMIFKDLNFLIENVRNNNLNAICQIYSIGESLNYYRSVILSDERFIEDNFEIYSN